MIWQASAIDTSTISPLEPPVATVRALSTPLLIATGCSAGAGLVHAAAAGTHTGDDTLVTLFATVAVVQLALAAAAVASRTRAAIGVLGLANAVAVGAWALSRTRGLDWIDSLAAKEAVGRQDLFAAMLGAGAVVGSVVALAPWRRQAATAGPAAWLAVGASLGLAIPGMTAPHTHSASHAHDHPGSASVAVAGPVPGEVASAHTHAPEAVVPAMAPDSTVVHTDDHDDDHAHAASGDVATGPVVSVDDPRLSDEQRRAAQQLIDRTTGAMARFTDEASITAAGYLSIGDGLVSEYEHFVNYPMLVDGRVLDPGAIESIVMQRMPDGTKRIASAMYILESGSTMADVPDIAGELTTWHDHQDLCWDPTGTKLMGVLVNGTCVPGGEFRPTAPMLHVWLVEHECGPFAGIEGSGHGGCGSHDH